MLIRAVGAVLLLVAGVAQAGVYDFGKNGENKNNITWESRATVETMIGTTVQCNGVAVWDADVAKCSIAAAVPVASISSGIPLRDEHMRSKDWLDAESYPTITFITKKVEASRVQGEYVLTGDFTCKGVTKEIQVNAKVTTIPAKKGLEQYGFVGDILHLETKFPVKLADHNIHPPQSIAGVKVADTVTVTVDLFGFTNNKAERTADEVAQVVSQVKAGK